MAQWTVQELPVVVATGLTEYRSFDVEVADVLEVDE